MKFCLIHIDVKLLKMPNCSPNIIPRALATRIKTFSSNSHFETFSTMRTQGEALELSDIRQYCCRTVFLSFQPVLRISRDVLDDLWTTFAQHLPITLVIWQEKLSNR